MNFEIPALNGNPPKKLIVFLHGLGSNGQDLLGLVPYLQDSLPDCHFYSPNGIQECDMHPFGFQWFSLQDRDPHVIAKELELSAPQVLDIIDEKLAELELEYKDLILFGFSQGTMLSLYISTSLSDNISATIGFSGAFFEPKNLNDLSSPICLIHGTNDDVVPFQKLMDAEENLKRLGAKKIIAHKIDGLGHSIDLQGLKYAIDFINENER